MSLPRPAALVRFGALVVGLVSAIAAAKVFQCASAEHEFSGSYECVPLPPCNSDACSQIDQTCATCSETFAEAMCQSVSSGGHSCTHERWSNGCGGIGYGWCTLVGGQGMCLFIEYPSPSQPCCRTYCDH